MDFAMLEPATPSSTWDPKARRCRNPLGRFTGPPTNATAAARLLESYGYTVTIQQGRLRYSLRFPGGNFSAEATASHLVRFAKRQYSRRTKS